MALLAGSPSQSATPGSPCSRSAVFTFFGLQGLFLEATYTFALVLTAVLLTLLVGIPLGVLSGVYGRVAKVITPVLDFMQTLPTFVYLAPLALVFLIGPASAVIATVIYAAPPVIRLTAHGIRYIPENTREASDSLGTTGLQRLLTLQLPMAQAAPSSWESTRAPWPRCPWSPSRR